MSKENNSAADIGAQRDGIMRQLASVQVSLEKKGIGAAFYRAAKPDPVGDMGFMGSLLFHGLLFGPIEGFVGANLPFGYGELDNALIVGGMESLSVLNENRNREQRPASRLKCSFYPLGRKQEAPIIDKKLRKAAAKSRFVGTSVQADLAFMFELTDMLNKLDAKEASEVSDKSAHLVVRESAAPDYKGVERRRRPRPEGMFSA